MLEGLLRRMLESAAKAASSTALGGVLADALAVMLAGTVSFSHKPDACAAAGQALADLGFDIDALSCYSKAVRLEPTNALAWYGKGVLLYRMGRYAEAERCLQIAAESSASEEWTPSFWYWRAQALIELARDLDAIACLDKALDIDPGFADALESMGICFHYSGKFEEALICYDRTIDITPVHSSAWLNRGYALARLERHDEAMRSFDQALRYDPECVEGWIGKGHVLEVYGQLEEAISLYDRALLIDPECVDALMDKADCLEELGRHEEAEQCLDTVVSLEVRDLDLLLSGHVL